MNQPVLCHGTNSAHTILRSYLTALIVSMILPGLTYAIGVEVEYAGEMRPFNNIIFYRTLNDGFIFPRNDSPVLPNPEPIDLLLSLNSTITGRFSYDTTSPRLPSSPSDRAFYQGMELSTNLLLPGKSSTNFQIEQPNIKVFNDLPEDNFSIDALGMLSIFDLNNPNPQTITFDLLDDINFTDHVTGIPILSQLPVRLTEPSQLPTQAFTLILLDDTGTAFESYDLPTQLNLGDFQIDGFHNVFLQYQYEMAISVDPADYASAEDFVLAAAFVANNLTEISFLNVVSYNITDLTSSVYRNPLHLLILR